MAFDMSRVVEGLGEEVIGKIGEPLGLEKETSVRVAHALAAHAGVGNDEMIRAAAADTGLPEDVVKDMGKKLVEAGMDKVMNETPIGAAVDHAKEQAMAAMSGVGDDALKKAGGFLGGLFGRK